MNQYQKINEVLEELIATKKYQEAIDYLQSEITTSYIPFTYINQFQKIIKELENKIVFEKLEREKKLFLETLKQNDLMKYILKNNKIDFDFLQIYINKFKKINRKEQFDVFQIVLSDSNINQMEKFRLMNFLVSNCKHNFIFYNAILHKKRKVDLNLMFEFTKNTKQLQKLITTKSNKDVTIEQIAKAILDLINIYYFPFLAKDCWNYDNKKIATLICDYIFNNFGMQNENKESEWIKEIISYFNN